MLRSWFFRRQRDYPPPHEQLEALMDWVAEQPGQKPEKTRRVLDQIAAVKVCHPKPTCGQTP